MMVYVCGMVFECEGELIGYCGTDSYGLLCFALTSLSCPCPYLEIHDPFILESRFSIEMNGYVSFT